MHGSVMEAQNKSVTGGKEIKQVGLKVYRRWAGGARASQLTTMYCMVC